MRKFWMLVSCSIVIAGQCLAADKVFPITPSDPAGAYARFHIGASGIYATIEKGLLVTVDSTEPGTPAEGKFEKGDVLLTVNGKPVSDPEPYIVLGDALTAAEAGDGRLTFTVKRGGKEEEVAITIPVLGAYSKTWPLNCRKSDTIVREAAAFIAQPENLKDPGFFGGLVLLSTGDDKYLPAVKELVDRNSPEQAGGLHWANGYLGILIGEYYLRTGDESALPRLKALCDYSAETQCNGGWSAGGTPNPGYVNGGLMNPAGLQNLTTFILARECGVEVDEGAFERALTFFYRFAVTGGVPYGDHRSEGWLSANGKNGMLAGAMSLLDGKAYRMAAQTMSLDMADSYQLLGCGHASVFGDHVWRGLGSVHVSKDRQANYRRSMDKLTWYYDLSRLPHGGLGMLPLGPHAGVCGAGHGLTLAYTAPRKTLRITGAPHTRYSKKVKAPDLPWGRPRDLEFLRTEDCKGFGKGEMEPHETAGKLGACGKSPEHADNDKAFCVRMMRHYDSGVRRQAGQVLGRMGATNEIAEALQHPDARVRRAGLEGLTQYRPWGGGGTASFPPPVVSQEFLPFILKILKDKGSAFWEIDGALLALGMAEPHDVTANLDLIRPYLRHEEWWLRQAAWFALQPVMKDPALLTPLLPELVACLTAETHVMPRRTFTGCMQSLLKDENTSGGIKQKVIAGMLRAMHETVIEPGPLAAIGINSKYEMPRYFLEQAPESALQVVNEVEWMLSQPTGWEAIFGPFFTGDSWGNPGAIKSLERLPPEKSAPILAACKRIMAQVEEKKVLMKEQGKDVTNIEATQAAVAKAIKDYDRDWRVLVPTSKYDPQPWRYLMWNAENRPTPADSGSTRLPDAPPPAGMDDWYRPEFDDSGWKEGNAIFGVWKDFFHKLDEKINTEMTDDYILLRKIFEVDDPDLRLARLKVLSRCPVEVHLNGEKIFASEGSAPAGRSNYLTIRLTPEPAPDGLAEKGKPPEYFAFEGAVGLIVKGRNTLAVKTKRDYYNGKPYGLIDVGLEAARTVVE